MLSASWPSSRSCAATDGDDLSSSRQFAAAGLNFFHRYPERVGNVARVPLLLVTHVEHQRLALLPKTSSLLNTHARLRLLRLISTVLGFGLIGRGLGLLCLSVPRPFGLTECR
jgi:hypothetical protein